MRRVFLPACLLIAVSAFISSVRAADAAPGDWSEQQIAKFPASEKPVHLFNGHDFTGWQGHVDPYWSIVTEEASAVIVGKNTAKNAPRVSTYLQTDKKYRNFRLVFEAKLVTGEMHTGIALWGRKYESGGEKFSYQGHLVMFPSGYGLYDLFRRNSIYQDKNKVAQHAGKQHDWNHMEILAIGHRIRHVINGTLAVDWSDPKPELCQAGPIGLQLHANPGHPQEVHWRGLILSENPEDHVITAEK